MSPRSHPSLWADARFLIGVALVIASVLGVWFVVTSARNTVAVAIADSTIVPGQKITTENVRWIDVSLSDAADRYVTTLPADSVATRPVQEGELIPAASLIGADRSDVTTVVISSTTEVASTLGVGSSVEVWMSPMAERAYGPSELLIADATVAAIRESSGIASSGEVTLELIVARDLVPDILDAQASKAALWAVPLGGVR